MTASINEFLNGLWEDYIHLTPQAARIHAVLEEQNQTIVNDHIAFRTFDFPGMSIPCLEKHFLKLGYKVLDDYQFPDKHLTARAYFYNQDTPKIFLSQLHIEELPVSARTLLLNLLNHASPVPDDLSVFSSGRLWSLPTEEETERLLAISEYAGWLAAMGFHPNHFTLSMNHLSSVSSWENFFRMLEPAGVTLNTQGGLIKGSQDVLLEQASTMADEVLLESGNRSYQMKTCFYEFAWRFDDARGQRFHGFVTDNANRIFSSTDRN